MASDKHKCEDYVYQCGPEEFACLICDKSVKFKKTRSFKGRYSK